MGDTEKKRTSVGAVLYFGPIFRPFKACEIARRNMEKQPNPPDRTVDVMVEIDGARHEFTMADFLARLGIPARSELTDSGDDDAA